jgi:hypothetical protein
VESRKTPVFFHFDVPLAPGEDRFEVNVDIPDHRLLILQSCHVALYGTSDELHVAEAGCSIHGQGMSDGGLKVSAKTSDGTETPNLRPVKILLNHVTRVTTPKKERLFTIGPPTVFLPAVEELNLICFRSPATAGAVAIISLTGTIQPYEGPAEAAG